MRQLAAFCTSTHQNGAKRTSPNEVWPYDAAGSPHRIEYPNAGVHSRPMHNVRHPASMRHQFRRFSPDCTFHGMVLEEDERQCRYHIWKWLPHQLMAGPNIANVEAPAITRTAKPTMPPEWLSDVGTQLYAQLLHFRFTNKRLQVHAPIFMQSFVRCITLCTQQSTIAEFLRPTT